MRKRQWIGLGIAVLLATMLVTPATAANAAPWGEFTNVANGECMEVSHDQGNINKAWVRQWNCVGGDTQQWEFIQLGSHVSVINKWSGRCLQPVAYGPGSRMVVEDCNGSIVQQWETVKTETWPQFRNVDNDLCLRVPSTDRQEGLILDQRTCDDYDMFKWYL